MIIFPYAKINIGLHITGKRADGYHNIETVLYPLKISDALEIIPSSGPALEFTLTDEDGLVAGEDNLCVKAYRALEKAYSLSPVKMHLHKNIPSGAGLGGGSSDAAHTLALLNQLFELKLSKDKLQEHARLLGSDCAFFLENRPVFASGRGDELSPAELDLGAYCITVVMPRLKVATAAAYAEARPRQPAASLQEQLQIPPGEWRETVKNDFEESVFEKFPGIASVKETLYSYGAEYASMSGSGAAVYGIFREKTE
ncbi:MAG TPA: 4-(cytidine 5'-diphospho)-2-C-methyl-D-erythritol kinase, partial [Anseongella sp.]|nr:4-(cytidine 5'-diphospho)-2-C-methyl-D-erythritol kinase [Anseongella sp.]